MKFLGALQLILITLKLMGYITWGWALVLSPLIVYIVPLDEVEDKDD